ncbi:MAG: VIT1/CCC1 transporter family protein [Candidatus Omnitrophica bacterium]|nr:VIT1/CCC1 transporter family protein [Candidatus Omnitrophota bacterium]
MKDPIRSRIREAVFGIQDGLVSTLGALTGIAVGTQNSATVVIAGFVIVVVESLSMAAGSYLSSKSNREYLQRLLDEERRSIEENPHLEREELHQMYKERGFSEEEIRIVARRLFQNKEWLLEDMAHKELGIVPSDLEEPLSNAVVMGISYVAGGVVPVLPYVLFPLQTAVEMSVLAAASALFIFGGIKGVLVKRPWVKSGLEMLLIAGIACGVGYLIGFLAQSLTA